MSADQEGLKESEVPLFDVTVRVPTGGNLEAIRHKAINDVGMAEERIDALLKALQNGPKAKIGTAVPKDKADKAKVDFGKAGLIVELSPVLSLQTMKAVEADGSSVCPACQKRIMLPANRQCPSCGVFVDKVNDEFLLKRKIMEQERARAEAKLAKDGKDSEKRNREHMEAALRDKIRAEMEAEYGLKEEGAGIFAGKAGLVRAGAGVALLVGAILIGRFSHQIPGMGGTLDPVQAKAAQGGASGAMAAAAGAAGAMNKAQEVDSMITKAMEKGLPDEVLTNADGTPLDEDSLLKMARNGGGKGLSVEQAVAAAGQLAKTVGNNTLDKAMAGAMPPGGTPGANPGTAAGGPGGAAGGAPSAAGNASAAAVTLAPELKLGLSSEFAVRLAELGQTARSREVFKSLQGKPEVTADPKLAGIVRLADVQGRAWALDGTAPGKASQQASTLKDEISKITDPVERTLAFARAGSILSRHATLPREAGLGFIVLAGESIKSLPAAQQQNVMGDWTVAMGEALLADLSDSARTGRWARAQALYTRLSATVAQAPSADAAARLQGIEYRARIAMGLADKVDAAIETGLMWVSKAGGAAAQARALRGLVAVSENPSHPKFQDALARVQGLADAAKGAERVKALGELAQLMAEAGQRDKAVRLRDQASEASASLPPAEGSALTAELLVRVDLALARARHAEAAYADAESLLQRVAGYLL
ncbi:MAG: hypothetical protein IPK34_18505 [Ramlibacter sp.]|jgi:hypothetical protein|nr:hypothetical protein [Ramlibacter sp.]